MQNIVMACVGYGHTDGGCERVGWCVRELPRWVATLEASRCGGGGGYSLKQAFPL